jgi:phosphatidyl-myo-inositol alpha-mannosyltransferase
MLKIGIVSEYYYPLLGGISEHVHNTALQLTRDGHQVQVITSNHQQVGNRTGQWPDAGAFEVVRVGHALPVPWNGSVTNVSVGFAHIWHDLKHIIDRGNFDILHMHSPLVLTLPPLAIVAADCPSVATFHSYFDHSAIYQALKRPLKSFILDKLAGSIAVSASCIRALRPYFKIDPRIIPNGIDTTLFSPAAPPVAAYDDGRINLLFLSRFEPRNGLDLMLRAFARVRSQVRNVRLIVVGDGKRREDYQRLVDREFGPDVQLVGPKLEQRPSFYTTADIYCAPISKASFGMTLLEAMACGRPIVATDNDGYRDLLSPKEGLLVPPHDPVVFADAIMELIGDAVRRREMGEAGRAKAQQFAWPSVTARIVSYYEEILKRP